MVQPGPRKNLLLQIETPSYPIYSLESRNNLNITQFTRTGSDKRHNLYKYENIQSSRGHFWGILKAIWWGFPVSKVYRFDRELKTRHSQITVWLWFYFCKLLESPTDPIEGPQMWTTFLFFSECSDFPLSFFFPPLSLPSSSDSILVFSFASNRRNQF